MYSTSCQSQETKEWQENHDGNEGGGDCVFANVGCSLKKENESKKENSHIFGRSAVLKKFMRNVVFLLLPAPFYPSC